MCTFQLVAAATAHTHLLLLQLLPTKEMAEGAEFIMPLMIGFLVVGLVMSLGGPTGKLHNSYNSRCTAVVS
jgi:glycerol uptake facilitator-like aquaporin